jgi:tetratricopeptide (TPR) repeat protein
MDKILQDHYQDVGSDLIKQGDYKGAIEHFGKMLDKYPDYLNARYFRGIAYNRLGMYQNAIIEFSLFLEQVMDKEEYSDEERVYSPMHAEAFFERGLAYGALQNYLCAVDDLDMTIEIDPSNVRKFRERAMLCITSGRKKKAVGDLTRVLLDSPLDVDLYFLRGQLYDELNISDRAVNDFNIVIQLKPEKTDAYFCRARCIEKIGDYKTSLKDYYYLMEVEPTKSRSWFAVGNIFLKRRETERAAMNFQKVLELDPAGPIAWQAINLLSQCGPVDDLINPIINLAILSNVKEIEFSSEPYWNRIRVSLIMSGIPMPLVAIYRSEIQALEDIFSRLCGINTGGNNGVFLHSIKNSNYYIKFNKEKDQVGETKLTLSLQKVHEERKRRQFEYEYEEYEEYEDEEYDEYEDEEFYEDEEEFYEDDIEEVKTQMGQQIKMSMQPAISMPTVSAQKEKEKISSLQKLQKQFENQKRLQERRLKRY